MINGWKVKVTKTDGTSGAYTVSPRTIVAFERQFKTGLAVAFTQEQKMEHLFWLGWEAERAAGHVVPLFDPWLETVVSVEVETENLPLDRGA